MKNSPDRGPGYGELRLEPPEACASSELADFERLVRQGFAGSDAGLPARIRSARLLASLRDDAGELIAIAGLKAPSVDDRKQLFARAGSVADADAYELELGWVFVVPARRRAGCAALLCRKLLEREIGSPAFATTRPDNGAMIRILETLAFERSGSPYVHTRRNERLVLFVRHAAGRR